MNEQDYLQAASRLEKAEGLDRETALMRVLLARLQEMDIPVPLVQSLERAASHWYGHAGDLLEEKVKVWRYIKSIGPSGTDMATREGRAARALLCVLDTAPDEEAQSMTVEWFATMVESAS